MEEQGKLDEYLRTHTPQGLILMESGYWVLQFCAEGCNSKTSSMMAILDFMK